MIPLHSARSDGSCSCREGAACESQGKHPRLTDWTTQASNDLNVIAEWTAAYPDANLGVATGTASGFFVLDVDPDKGGDETLAAILAEHGDLPLTPQAQTGSGGAHYLFQLPDFTVTNKAGRSMGLGLDIRGDGGQIVVAPSRSAKGPYRWVHAPWDTPLAAAPAWLLERLRTRATTAGPAVDRGYFPPASPEVLEEARDALDAHGPAVDGDGGGLHTVHAAAILTHDFALTDEEAWPLFEEWNQTCEPPWELEDLRERLRRGRKYGKAEYGCKRGMDCVAAGRKLINDWRDDPSNDPDALELLKKLRGLPFDDPAQREVIQNEAQAATGRGATAIALPRVSAPRPQRAAIVTPWSAYGFDLNGNGAPVANLNNATLVLERDRREIWFDEFSQRIRTPDGEWSDVDAINLALEMQRKLGITNMSSKTAEQAALVYARKHTRDHVREALERATWDGTERLACFLTNAFGAADDEYTRAASRNVWRSMVARALQPGCKADTMLVLEGAQGIRKSTALREIVGDPTLFAEASESPTSKDFFLALQGKLLVEIAEMDAFSRADVAAVKRILSCQVDRYRAPYAHATQDWPRRGIFVGTTNRSDWARDDTGARRFWPVRCSRVDLDYVREHRAQLFAEAVADVKAGASWWEMPREATEAAQEARFQGDPWEEELRPFLDSRTEPVTVVECLRHVLVGLDRMDRAAQMRVASVLRRCGFEKVDGWRDGRKQKFWRRKEVGSP
jgi:hypothetical protein